MDWPVRLEDLMSSVESIKGNVQLSEKEGIMKWIVLLFIRSDPANIWEIVIIMSRRGD